MQDETAKPPPEPPAAEPASQPAALPRAWQPFTPRGIAAFALASTGRLLLTELLVGLICGGTICWLLHWAWFPVVKQAIQQLPEHGDIANGSLQWTNGTPSLLAMNKFLSVVVDLEHTGASGQTADLQLQFGRGELYLAGLLGYVTLPYPSDAVIAFNRADLRPWWGAWSQALLAGSVLGTAVGLMLLWGALALAYAGPARVLGFMLDRPLSWGAAWKLCSAALMPGAILFSGAILLYSLTLLDLVRLSFFAVFHLVVGWVYVFTSALCLPKATVDQGLGANPFVASPSGSEKTPQKNSGTEGNPFR